MTWYAAGRSHALQRRRLWVITCLIWSTVWLFIKIGVTEVAPISFAAMRLRADDVDVLDFRRRKGLRLS